MKRLMVTTGALAFLASAAFLHSSGWLYFGLGVMHDKGRYVVQDHKKAAEYYSRGAEQGRAQAQYNLGVSYERGDGVPQDYSEAVRMYQSAANQGFAIAQHSRPEHRNADGRPIPSAAV